MLSPQDGEQNFARITRYQGVEGTRGSYRIARLFLEQLAGGTRPVFLVVTSDLKSASSLVTDLRFFLSQRIGETNVNPADHVRRLFAWEVLPFDELSPADQICVERIATLDCLLGNEPVLAVTTCEALLQRVLPPELLRKTTFRIETQQQLGRDDLVAALDASGYVRTSLVEEHGQLAARGAVVDFFPPGFELPVRVELFGDVIDSIRVFDPSDQRSTQALDNLTVLPVSELVVGDVRDDVALRPMVSRLKARALELELPERTLEPFLDALRSGARYPGLEHLHPLVHEETATLADYLPSNVSVVVVDELNVQRSADDFEALVEERADRAENDGRLFPPPDHAYLSPDWLSNNVLDRAQYYIEGLRLDDLANEDDVVRVDESKEVLSNEGLTNELHKSRTEDLPLKPLAVEIERRFDEKLNIAIVVGHHSRVQRLQELLDSYDVSTYAFEGGFLDWRDKLARDREFYREVAVVTGFCEDGVRVPREGFQLICEHEIFPAQSRRRPQERSAGSVRRVLGSLAQLQVDDYIVHVDHGVGMYRGLRQIEVAGKIGEFLFLEYADEARLFLPVDNIGKIKKYVGAEGKKPALNKLGTKNWERSKAKVKESVTQLAGELIGIYAAREIAKGFSYGELDSDDWRFAETFAFTETPDQEKAIADVLADMASGRPMDRLVCGDVGYGKTEVALRAAFKAVNAGKQVAVLVPTTVLADQHYTTFAERLADFPINVGAVSRFFSTAENKETLKKLAAGKIDIIIGTHRLLSRDVYFKNLGLLVIDEEHRFGVAHKEKFKRLRREVDVLTLTATPIPRTLHMSMLGIRDLSVIETPPVDRHVIRTYLAPYSDAVVREAIMRELGRSGQVFYIHNRVQNIAAVAAEVQALVPEARLAVGHGQMKESELEAIMHSFQTGEVDVLVSTTIVESGLDIPNANTMIIRQADRFGLAELYQLRGRVGRSSRRAYAYMLVSDPKTLGPEARKRLKVLQSLDDLGMGFRLALQDMEIRGAGNLLGKDQSGQVNTVGFELYSDILKEAVRRLREEASGEPKEPRRPLVDPEVNVGFPAYIPSTYIPDVREKLVLYQRLVELSGEASGAELAEEIEDRFGRMPEEVVMLIELMVFRALLRRVSAVSATYRNQTLRIAFHQQALLDPEQIISVVSSRPSQLKFTPDLVLEAVVEDVEIESPRDLTSFAKPLLEELGAY